MNKHYNFTSLKTFLLSLFAVLFCSLGLQGQTQFAGYVDSDWHNSDNWSAGLPGPGNNATITGGATPDINATLNINFTITNYGSFNINAAVTNNGTIQHYGADINIGSSGSLSNYASIDNRGNINVAVGTTFNNNESGNYSSTAQGVVHNSGTLFIAGTFANLGTINNDGTVNSVGDLTNNNTIQNNATFNLNAGQLINVNGANVNNANSANFNNNGGGTLDNSGTVTNEGTFTNAGTLDNNSIVQNNGLLNNAGTINNGFRFYNNSTFNNNNGGNFINTFEFFNAGALTNNFYFENGGALNNQIGGTFTNSLAGTIDNQFGSTLTNDENFLNEGTIESVGTINNNLLFTNNNLIFTNSGGQLNNNGNFVNNNSLSNLNGIANTGVFENHGQLANNSGGIFTNNGTLNNYNTARIANEFELHNNNLVNNHGTVENGVRIFNDGTFNNFGYLSNIGDFDNLLNGVFENMSTGVIENMLGGIYTNDGIINNSGEIFNLFCSSFVNNNIINNNNWLTNKGLFFNYGVVNGMAIMEMAGAVVTGEYSNAVCQDITVNLDANGVTVVLGSSVAILGLDTCSTLNLTINAEDEITFTCVDKGIHPFTLEIEDRKGNSVKCRTKIEVVDDESPTFHNCPNDVVVVTTSTSAPATWTAPTATDNCFIPVITSTHNSGDIFPLGTTQVIYTADDGCNNINNCIFNVMVVKDGDCADITSVRKVTSTNDNCGVWCNGAYAMAMGSNQCYEGGSDLLFIEYNNGTALLVGNVTQGNSRAYVYVELSGYTATAPANSPKYGLCVTSGGAGWEYYTSFIGWLTFDDGVVVDITRYGPAFQMGIGGNLQDPTLLGASAWFSYGNYNGDFNFRLSDPINCQNSIYIEAECADHIGSKWSIQNDAAASNGKYLLPHNAISYDYPPMTAEDLVTYEVDVVTAGYYRIYVRALAANGSGDSYWVRVNNGDWVKWNTINAPYQNSTYQWDQIGEWRGASVDIPLSFNLTAGINKIDFSWREPNARLDKLFITFIGEKPTGLGGDAAPCNGPPPSGECEDVTITIVPDNYGKDITWELKNDGGSVLASGGPYWDSNTDPIVNTICLEKGCYDFVIYDSYGDGLCCNWGNGYYEISDGDGHVVASGGQYQYIDTKNFCVDGKSNGGGEPPANCNKNALLVVGSVALNGGDAAVKSRLEGLGYNVTTVDDDLVSTSDGTGKGLILISSTIQSTKVNTKFKNIDVPVMVWESYLYDDMKMTGTGAGSNYGNYSSTSRMTIGNSTHPITAGLSGNLQIFTSAKSVTWGNPGIDAYRLGYIPGEPACAMLFTYEKGANMIGITAPERRVGIYLRNNTATALNAAGWLIFDAAVEWASGCDGTQNLQVDHDVLDLTLQREERQVNLFWKNNTAYKNDFFVIERSLDGENFEALNEMYAYSEENKSTKIYDDVDLAPQEGMNYYRIKVEFLDGTVAFSEIQDIEFQPIADFALYPNPTTDFVNINLERMQGMNATIRLIDWTGRPVEVIEMQEIQTLSHLIDLSKFETGRYAVSVSVEGKKPVTRQLIISN